MCIKIYVEIQKRCWGEYLISRNPSMLGIETPPGLTVELIIWISTNDYDLLLFKS